MKNKIQKNKKLDGRTKAAREAKKALKNRPASVKGAYSKVLV